MGLKIGNVIQAKAATLAITDSTAKLLFSIPAGAMVMGVRVAGGLSSGGTTGTISVGTSDTAGDTLDALSTHAAYAACPTLNDSGALPFNRASTRTNIFGTFGGDDSAGGDFTIIVEYM